MRLPAGAVKQIRPDWDIEVYRPSEVFLGGDLKGKLWGINGIRDPDSIDLLVMQRVGKSIQVSLLEWARSKGIATVMDVDDAMWCIDKENSAYPSWNGSKEHWGYIDQSAKIADLVTVTTPVLARRYGIRTEVLPNCVPGELESALISIRHEFDPTPTIGWAGFTHTHPNDLKVVGDAVRRVVEETGCRVRVIGDAEGAARDWGLKEIDQLGPVQIGMPYYTALTSVDVALVPLQDNPFNRGKSYLKALEFAAVGVPVVASPTPANRELARSVPISLADSPDEWYRLLKMRVVEHVFDTDRSRQKLFQGCVKERHTYEVNAEHWASVWERALVRRSRMAV
jgi:glycosyltransferase involved in cell wall biosynthesis